MRREDTDDEPMDECATRTRKLSRASPHRLRALVGTPIEGGAGRLESPRRFARRHRFSWLYPEAWPLAASGSISPS